MRALATVVTLWLVAVGLVGAAIGVWVQPRVDRRAMEGLSAITTFTIGAGITVLGWVWFAAGLRAS